MNKNKILYIVGICLLIMLFIGCNSKTTTPTSNLPVLTQAQMYQDFDSLVYIIKNVNPQLTIKKKITGIDYLAELKLMRNEVKDCNKTEKFILLINKALTLMQDGHCNILPASDYVLSLNMAKEIYGFIDSNAYNNTKKYLSFLNEIESKLVFMIKIKYINGEYYLIESFENNYGKFEKGIKLLECDGENIHNYVNKIIEYRNQMKWDNKNKRYFLNTFFSGFCFMNKENFVFTFLNSENKKKYLNFNYQKLLYENSYNPHFFNLSPLTEIKFSDKNKILYIRLKNMKLKNLNLDEINSKVKSNFINKIIIDIRGNGGGNDSTWLKLLGRIIDKPIIYPVKQLVKNTNIVRYKLKNDIKDFNNIEKISLLDNEEFLVIYNQNDTIYPDKKSIKYKGKIYLIQNDDIYSSALAFSSVALYTDKIVSVGQTTGWMGGRCITPIAFTLPNSKLIFTIEPAIDATNINKLYDFWKDSVEVPFNPTLDYYINKAKSKEKTNIENDPYYKKILELN